MIDHKRINTISKFQLMSNFLLINTLKVLDKQKRSIQYNCCDKKWKQVKNIGDRFVWGGPGWWRGQCVNGYCSA